jgi:hypothetical protein
MPINWRCDVGAGDSTSPLPVSPALLIEIRVK